MSIPDFQSVMRPLLDLAGDQADHRLRDAVVQLAERFQLSPEERMRVLPSGQQTVFHNRVAWASTYLRKAGLLEQVRRGVFRISATGLEALKTNPQKIDMKYLERYPGYVAFRDAARSGTTETQTTEDRAPIAETPEESLERANRSIREALAQELLSRIAGSSPAFFENLVIDLLVKMGYGGSRRDAAERIGRSGDGGIDGIIKEDQLGLDAIYVQAKRWQGSVGRPEIQKFVGALHGHRARKGVFITSSTFTAEASGYASGIDSKVVLIDGPALANFMIDFGLGVSTTVTYAIKRIDSDYFDEELE